MIGLYLGDTPVLVLNDNEKVRQALNHRDFDGRPDILTGRLRDPNLNLHGVWQFISITEKQEIKCFTIFSSVWNRDFLHGR